MYFLTPQRLGFRTWSPNDFEIAMGLWGDSDVTRFIGGPFSSGQVRERLQREIEQEALYGVQYWPIFDHTSGEHVGCCGLRPYSSDPKIREIGFHIRKEKWHAGYARGAANSTIEHAFSTLNVRGLFAGHNPKNEASAMLLKKLGFQCTHDEFYPPTELNHPSYLLTR
jgi:ribosomal-protein-alanine N-acetyltransferase